MKTSRYFAPGAIALCAVLAVAEVHAADVEVKIDNFTFGPQQVNVKVGDTVIWTNRDDIPHTVMSKTMIFRSKVMDTDDKFSFTFTRPGNYPYFCSLHPHMTGAIVVEAGTAEK